MVDVTMNRWGPDTCRCKLFYSWDKDLPAVDRVHSYVSGASIQPLADSIRSGKNQAPKLQPPLVICPAHQAIGDSPALLTAVNGENTRKNISLGLVSDEKADIDTRDVQWSFDRNRNLLLVIERRLTSRELARVQAAADLQFGTGKVIVSGTPAPDAVITVGSDPDVHAGAQTVLNVVLNHIVRGLSGFNMSAEITPTGAAKFVDVVFPAYAQFDTHSPDPVDGPSLTTIAAIDLASQAQGELFNFLLFQLVIESINGATAAVTISVTGLDDDDGNNVTRDVVRGVINQPDTSTLRTR